jgi:hypothetical protein
MLFQLTGQHQQGKQLRHLQRQLHQLYQPLVAQLVRVSFASCSTRTPPTSCKDSFLHQLLIQLHFISCRESSSKYRDSSPVGKLCWRQRQFHKLYSTVRRSSVVAGTVKLATRKDPPDKGYLDHIQRVFLQPRQPNYSHRECQQ